MGTVSLTLRVAVFLYFNKILSDSFGSRLPGQKSYHATQTRRAEDGYMHAEQLSARVELKHHAP